MENSRRIITLLTDFGLSDHYVSAMKGIMLGLNPDLNLVDISHLVPPQDIHTGAFLLGQAHACFPAGTIHLAVVDPGVGTERRILAATAGGSFFVAPDNGILTYVKMAYENFQTYEVTSDHYFHKPVSNTFHGRDIFAPIAAWISRDIPIQRLGQEMEDPVLLEIPAPASVKEGLIQATILAVDHFGNLITNLTPDHLPQYDPAQPFPFKILAGEREITQYHEAYGKGEPGEIFIITGSTGNIEISMRNGSAAETLGLESGNPVEVVLS